MPSPLDLIRRPITVHRTGNRAFRASWKTTLIDEAQEGFFDDVKLPDLAYDSQQRVLYGELQDELEGPEEVSLEEILDGTARFGAVEETDETDMEPGTGYAEGVIEDYRVQPSSLVPFTPTLHSKISDVILGLGRAYITGATMSGVIPRFGKFTSLPGILRYDSPSSGTSSQINCITYGKTIHVRVGASGLIQTSSDMINWSTRTSGVGTANLNFVLFDGTRFIAVGASGWITWSSDGGSWTAFQVGSNSFNCIAYSGSYYVIAGQANGTRYCTGDPTVSGNWTLSTGGQVDTRAYRSAVAVGSRVWLAGENTIIYTDTGTGFTISLQTGGNEFRSIIAIGASTLLAVGDAGIGQRSANSGSSWSSVTTGGGANSLRAFTANTYVYLIGQSGASQVSTDSGATFVAGPAVGTTDFLRFGIADPADSTRALVVGDNGMLRLGQYGVRAVMYPSDAERTAGTGGTTPVDFAYVDQPLGVNIPIP